MTDKKFFYKALSATAIPIALQNLLQSSLSFIDTLMIGQLGEVQIAAVGLANQIFFLISIVLFGIGSGTAIFTSQFWGADNKSGIQKIMGVSLLLGLSASFVFSFLSVFTPRTLLRVFTDNLPVVECGSSYLVWVGISYMFVAVSVIQSMTLRATGDTKTPMLITLVSLLTNVLGNWLLIFGIWIFPELGVAGAAISTALSRLLEMFLLLFAARKSPVKINLAQAFSFDRKFFSSVMKTALPVIGNESLWALGMTAYKMAYSRMGIDVIASVNVSESIQNLFFVVMIGVSNATAIMVGFQIGRGNKDNAQAFAIRSMILGFCIGALMGLLMAFSSPFIPLLFNISDRVRFITQKSLMSMSFLLPVKFMNMVNITGILRSGGDTRYSFITEILSVWILGVPIAFIGGLVFKIPIYYLYLLISCEEVSKFCFGLPRILRRKWINDLTTVDA